MSDLPQSPQSPGTTARPPVSRLWGGAIIVVLLLSWFAYLRWVSGVLPYNEKYPGGKEKTVGYLKRSGWSDYKRHGVWTTYFENGQKESQGHYELGRPVGEWLHWNEQGHRVPEPTTTGAAPPHIDKKP